jgi:hypothetical protein
MQQIEKAIHDKNFEAFGHITMQESNQFHATCLDSFPPIFYMNETSKVIIKAVHKYNAYRGGIKAAYTFDAGAYTMTLPSSSFCVCLVFIILALRLSCLVSSFLVCSLVELSFGVLCYVML